jgi:hypothetical protein
VVFTDTRPVLETGDESARADTARAGLRRTRIGRLRNATHNDGHLLNLKAGYHFLVKAEFLLDLDRHYSRFKNFHVFCFVG